MDKSHNRQIRTADWLIEDFDAVQVHPDYMSRRIVRGVKVQLRKAMRDSGISQSQLATSLGWTRGAVSRFFRSNSNIGVERLAKVASALGQVITTPEVVSFRTVSQPRVQTQSHRIHVSADQASEDITVSFDDTAYAINLSVGGE